VGQDGVGLRWPAGQGPGGRPVGQANFWGQEGLVKIQKILQKFIGILEMKNVNLSEFWSTRKWERFSRLPRI
jgi:hypothetical protein